MDGRIPIAIETGDIIINTINHTALRGHRVAIAPVEQFESKIISKILSNCDSWIGLTKQHINRIQTVQDNYFKKVFQVADSGTPVCMVRLDSQTLQVKWQILLKKIKEVRKTVDKDNKNICKKVLIAGLKTCDGGDLLNE